MLWKGGPATIGAVATGAVLIYGLAGMAKPQPKASARNMGFRGSPRSAHASAQGLAELTSIALAVIAQGATIATMLGVVAYQDWKRKKD
jgi:hypothetical protein